jgi:hemerythrin superfamily protein
MDEPRSAAKKIATQHRLIDSLVRNLEGALANGVLAEAEDRVQRLIHAIEAHFTLEEDYYFPRAEAERAELADKVRALRAEHVVLGRRLEQTAQHIGDGAVDAARATFGDFHEMFVRHEREELALLES